MRAISKGFRLRRLRCPRRISPALYVSNRIYRDRLRVGATRIDLDGNPAGVVTPDQVAHLQPRAKPVKPPNGTSRELKTAAAPTESPALKPSAIASVKRMSLADLRAAAQRRKVGNTG
jgi:sRNA-binding protein